MTHMPKHGLPTVRPNALAHKTPEQRWLVEHRWADQAVGIIGGEPKCGKSLLALDLAVGVAAAVPVLRRFAVNRAGPVLLFPAEDAAHIVRQRLIDIARAAGVDFDTLDIHLIDVPYLQIDQPSVQERLLQTVERIRPRLLILDPFVRLHRVDENVAAEVAPILAGLRQLQRTFNTAVVLVHHARKGAARARGGQALRGSSELHAWGDSNLYLRRTGERILMSVEHRAAVSAEPVTLEINPDRGAVLSIVDALPEPAPQRPSPEHRILQVLQAQPGPLNQRQLRELARLRAQTVSTTLARLIEQGRVVRTEAGYALNNT